MATNQYKSGEIYDYVNSGAAIASGAPVYVPNRGYGIAITAIAATTGTGSLSMCGIKKLARATGTAWAQGDPLYWDTDNSQLVNSPGTTPYKFIGLNAIAAGSSDAYGYVDLMGLGFGVHQRRNIVPLTSFRVHDAFGTNLPGAAGTDDLGLIGGTLGTNSPEIESVDFGGTSTTAYARVVVALPGSYIPGSAVTLRARAGMKVVADTSATLDAVAYRHDGDGGVSADLCATAAQSINSATEANYDFTITPTTLLPGDQLDIRLAFAGTDAGNAANDITARITSVEVLCLAA